MPGGSCARSTASRPSNARSRRRSSAWSRDSSQTSSASACPPVGSSFSRWSSRERPASIALETPTFLASSASGSLLYPRSCSTAASCSRPLRTKRTYGILWASRFGSRWVRASRAVRKRSSWLAPCAAASGSSTESAACACTSAFHATADRCGSISLTACCSAARASRSASTGWGIGGYSSGFGRPLASHAA